MTRKYWLLAYDIRDARRLRRVHAYLKKRGVPLQYSMFGLEQNDPAFADILGDVRMLIDESEDDVRAYHLPEQCQTWTLGRQSLPDGVELHATHVMRLLVPCGAQLRNGGLPSQRQVQLFGS